MRQAPAVGEYSNSGSVVVLRINSVRTTHPRASRPQSNFCSIARFVVFASFPKEVCYLSHQNIFRINGTELALIFVQARERRRDWHISFRKRRRGTNICCRLMIAECRERKNKNWQTGTGNRNTEQAGFSKIRPEYLTASGTENSRNPAKRLQECYGMQFLTRSRGFCKMSLTGLLQHTQKKNNKRTARSKRRRKDISDRVFG